MFKNSMSTLVLPANFHTSSENCMDFRDSLSSIDSNLPSLPPVTKWNYEDTGEYISNIDIKNTVTNLMNDQAISQHINANQYQTAQSSLLNCSKQSFPTLLPFGDSGCISLTDETSLISVKHSTSTPVHTMDSDNTPTTNASTTTISPINIDSLDRSNDTQVIPVISNKTDQSLQPMNDNYYTSASTITTTTTNTAINNANPVITIITTANNNNNNNSNENSSSNQLNEQQNVGLIYYSEENQTPVIKQTVEHKRNWNTPVNTLSVMHNQQDELNLDESPSDNELNLSSESMNRRNRADVKIQPYALRGNIEVFRCPLCSKDEIFSRGHLTNHLQDHQSNFKREDYKHVCCFCFSELSSNSSLERHLLTHTNHRPFNCNLCDKAFTTNGNLSRHIRTSHQVKTTVTNSFTPISTVTPSTASTSSSSLAPQLVPHHTSNHQHHQQQPILLPNWFQSSTGQLQSPSSSSTNIYPKLSSVYHSGGVNDEYRHHQNTSSSSSSSTSIKQLDLNTSRINTSQQLTTIQSNYNEMLKIRHDYPTPWMNLSSSTSTVNSNDKQHIDVIGIKSCMNNSLSNIIPTFIINDEPIKLEQTKSPLSGYDLHEQNRRDNHSEAMRSSSTSLYTENKNFANWSTDYTKHQEQHYIDNDNLNNKIFESSSWSSYNKGNNTTSEFLQFFSNYWLNLSKSGVLNNSTYYTTSVDPRTIIASLLPSSYLPVNNNAMNNDFTSVTMMSSLSTSTSSSSAAAATAGANGPVDTIGNFSKYTSESPRITICEIPSSTGINEMDNQVNRRFDRGSLYTASSGEYGVVSSSPNPNVQNNNNNNNLQVIRPKFFTGTNKHERQKSRIKKVRTMKTFSVRYILAKRRKSLTMIGKKRLSRKVADIKFRSLSSLSSSSKQRRECDMQQFQTVDAEYSSNRSHSSYSPEHCNSTRNNANNLSTDYTCSLSNFFSTSDRPSPSTILYTYNDKMSNDNENNNNDNTMLNTTEQNYLQPMESYPEILDLSLRNKNLQTYDESQKNTNDIQQFNRLYANPGNYSDMLNSKPKTFNPMNASTVLYPSYAINTTNTGMSNQPTVDTKSFGHEINLNNILHDICSLSVMQQNKTSAYTDNLANTTNTTNNQSSRLSMNLQNSSNNMSNAHKILSLRTNIPPVLIQPKKNSYKDAPKLITCPISGCSQKFPWNSSLKRHILTHTPHKPFACTRCTKSFSTKSNRERHMERVHRVSLKRQRQRFNQTSSMSIQSPSSGDNRSELSGHYSNKNSVGRATTATTTTTTTATLGDNNNNDQEIDGIEELREDEILSMNSNEKQAEDISNSLLIRAGDPVVEPNPERLYNAALLAVANSTRGGFTNFLNHVSSPSIINNSNNIPQNVLPNISIRQRQSVRGGGGAGGRRRPRRSNLLSMKNIPQIPLINMITESTSENKSTPEDPPIDLSLNSTMKNTSTTLTCPICSLSIGSRCFRRHLTLHQVDNPVFRCHLCQLTFQDQISTLTHWAMEHSNEWSKFVKKLNTNDTSTDILKQIQLSLKNNVNTTDTTTTHNYNSSSSSNNQLKVTCDIKETTSNTINISELKEPINYSAKLNNYNHNNDSRYVSCCVCLHRFGSQQDLQRHMRSHTGERPFTCPYCGKEFSLKHSMHRHARVHMKQTIKINTLNEASS
nr:unnamed protein product [Trichobilharzia regenti]